MEEEPKIYSWYEIPEEVQKEYNYIQESGLQELTIFFKHNGQFYILGY